MVDKEEIESLFKKMLKEDEEKAPNDKIYQKDMENIGEFRVNWKICGILGSQVYEKEKISYKFGENLENPDVSLVIRDSELAVRFLSGEKFEFDYGPGHNGGFKLNYTEGWKIIETGKGKKRVRINKPFVTARFNKEKNHHPYKLSKMPIFRNLVATRLTEDDIGFYIPINQSLGQYENQIIPIKVFEHFINKASNIVMLYNCGCRVFHDCQDHDHSLGCMYMGNDTLNLLVPEDKGKVVTKEEALERVKKSIENGLIPLLGRAMDEAEGFGIEDTGHFLSMCFCCACCCIDIRILEHATSNLNFLRRMEGLTVMVDNELCVGCGECLEACVWNGMEMHDNLAFVNQERCVGCGRCETSCSSDAISITIKDNSYVDKLIKTLESHVEVT